MAPRLACPVSRRRSIHGPSNDVPVTLEPRVRFPAQSKAGALCVPQPGLPWPVPTVTRLQGIGLIARNGRRSFNLVGRETLSVRLRCGEPRATKFILPKEMAGLAPPDVRARRSRSRAPVGRWPALFVVRAPASALDARAHPAPDVFARNTRLSTPRRPWGSRRGAPTCGDSPRAPTLSPPDAVIASCTGGHPRN